MLHYLEQDFVSETRRRSTPPCPLSCTYGDCAGLAQVVHASDGLLLQGLVQQLRERKTQAPELMSNVCRMCFANREVHVSGIAVKQMQEAIYP